MDGSVRSWQGIVQRGRCVLRPRAFVTLLAGVALLGGCFWLEGRGALAVFFQIAVLLSPLAAIVLAIASLLPLDRAAKQVEAKAQFALVDFLFLFFLVQMPMALLHGWLPDDWTPLRWLLVVYAWFAFGLMWLASVQRLSRAGVQRSGQRALFLGLVLPSAVLGVIVSPLLCVRYLNGVVRNDWRQAGVTLGCQVGLLLTLLISRQLTRWMVATANPSHTSAPSCPFAREPQQWHTGP